VPLYDFQCKKCTKVEEHIAKLEDRERLCDCGSPMERLITSRYYAQSDLEPYLDPHIGKEPIWIKSRKHRRQVMKEQGVYEMVGKGWI